MKAPAVRIKWKDELAQQYQHRLSADTQAKLKDAISMIDIEINEALAMFTEVLWVNAKGIEKNICSDIYAEFGNRWFDNECRECRKQVRKLLRNCRKTPQIKDNMFISI